MLRIFNAKSAVIINQKQVNPPEIYVCAAADGAQEIKFDR